MSKYEIPFLTACIRAFGRRFDMTRQAESMDETIDDLLIICQKNGGTLA